MLRLEVGTLTFTWFFTPKSWTYRGVYTVHLTKLKKIKKIFFSRTTWPISTKRGASSFKWRALHLRADNYKITKTHWRNFKIIFSRSTGSISTKLGTMHYLVKGTQVCSNKEPFNFHKVDNEIFLLFINFVIIICVYLFEQFFQVSIVAHGPLVFLWL